MRLTDRGRWIRLGCVVACSLLLRYVSAEGKHPESLHSSAGQVSATPRASHAHQQGQQSSRLPAPADLTPRRASNGPSRDETKVCTVKVQVVSEAGTPVASARVYFAPTGATGKIRPFG